METSNYMEGNSNIGICIGSVLGINRKFYRENQKCIIRVTSVSENNLCGIYQSNPGRASINVYSSSEVVKLPIKEEVLDSTKFFNRVNNEWISSDSLVVVSKNSEKFEKKWNIKIFDENHNLIFYSIFDFVHELQFFCFLHKINIDLKYGTIRLLYQDYLENV